MCADIVKFPGPPKNVATPQPSGGMAALEIAFDIHQMIVEGIVAGHFDDDTTAARVSVLYDKLHARYSSARSAIAESFFEQIYGFDPATFLEHVTSYRG